MQLTFKFYNKNIVYSQNNIITKFQGDFLEMKKNNNYKKNDPLGSYTGVCEKEYEEPVQDADDL